MTTMDRTCLECGEGIKGRADKKFCSDQCRNAYNNRHNSDTTNLMRNVNNTLRKNRRILEKLNRDGKTKVHRNQLTALNFNFDYLTRVYTTRAGSTYYYCYDQGYLPLENEMYLLVREQQRT